MPSEGCLAIAFLDGIIICIAADFQHLIVAAHGSYGASDPARQLGLAYAILGMQQWSPLECLHFACHSPVPSMLPPSPEACRHAISMPVRSHARSPFSRSDARSQVRQLEQAAESSWRTRDQLICCQASSSKSSSSDNGGAQQASDMDSSQDAAEARTEGNVLQLLALRGLLRFIDAKQLLAAVVQPTPTNSGRGGLGVSLSAIGLQRGPLSGGVKNATLRYDLPSPAVAVRNLVSPGRASPAGKLCTAQPRPQSLQQRLPVCSQAVCEINAFTQLALDGFQATRCASSQLHCLAYSFLNLPCFLCRWSRPSSPICAPPCPTCTTGGQAIPLAHWWTSPAMAQGSPSSACPPWPSTRATSLRTQGVQSAFCHASLAASQVRACMQCH